MGLNSFTHPDFWKFFYKLPKHIQKLADKKFDLFKDDPSHPSLNFSRKGDVWTVNIGHHYRAIAFKEGKDVVWFWIGSHEDYNNLMNRL
ncbi:MAG: type II toxin-antitoxin system RelE family toxin [Thermodesulfobacteriota bacterium]